MEIEMRKMILESDSIVIDGVELTYDEIKRAVIEQEKFNRLSDFLQTTFKKRGVANEQ